MLNSREELVAKLRASITPTKKQLGPANRPFSVCSPNGNDHVSFRAYGMNEEDRTNDLGKT